MIVALPLGGLLSDTLGWESVFYVSGGITMVWFVLWYFFIFDSPSVHPRISSEELAYLLDHTASKPGAEDFKLPRPPLWQMAKSVPFWTICLTQVGAMWGRYTIMTSIPTYLNNIHHYDLKKVCSSF